MKRSEHELKRIIEQAMADEVDLSARGLWFCVDRVEAFGQPPNRIKAWATLHFLPAGSPFCCGEPGCHLPIIGGKVASVSDRVRRAMGLTQEVVIEFGDRVAVNYHDGVQFKHEQSQQ